MNLLFLGASKRLTLAEQFQSAAYSLGMPLSLYSIERWKQVPIAQVAEILVCGAPFKSLAFGEFLFDSVEQYHVDLVIPLMDSATVALAEMKLELEDIGCHAVVSGYSICEKMEDKLEAEFWFSANGIPTPRFKDALRFPLIAKSRFGFGSRDQAVIRDDAEFKGFFSRRDIEDYLLQPFITGVEFTVDCYVSRAGRIISVLVRERNEIEAGEVMVSTTRHHAEIDKLSRKILESDSFEGPITLQFVDGKDGVVCIECNPRGGGGSTIGPGACGLDYPRWILQEQLGQEPSPVPEWASCVVMSRARRDIYFLPKVQKQHGGDDENTV